MEFSFHNEKARKETSGHSTSLSDFLGAQFRVETCCPGSGLINYFLRLYIFYSQCDDYVFFS